jgi:hypothetical protein
MKQLSHRVDSIDYAITITSVGGQFSAKWLCECGALGSHAGSFDSEDLAVQHAKDSLLYHHQSNHGPADQP